VVEIQRSSREGRFIDQWWRVGGILGIVWLVLFIVGAFIIQGESVERSDSIAEIRQYFVDDGDTYLLGDYLIGIGFIFFFLPFLIILRRVLEAGGNWAALLARIALLAGVVALIWGGIAGFFWGALAVGAAGNSEVDDSSIRTLMELDAYAFAGLFLPIGLMLGAAGASIWLSRVLWRWLGIIGLIGFLAALIGAAWPIDGDDEGALASIGLFGYLAMMIFVLLVSINLLMQRSRPVVASDPDVLVVVN
jgi:hypothetical protein